MPVAENVTTATKLAKDTSRVLDDAAKGPIILYRGNKPAITLVDRASWCDAAIAKTWLSTLSTIICYALNRFAGRTDAGYPSEFAWLRLFEDDDVRDFITELNAAVISALHTGRSWERVDAVVDEWRRSAALLEDDEMRARFSQTLEDVR